ncbi:MAG: YdcF family protein [bacterium]|nr:YdcF family protein [bacterium]
MAIRTDPTQIADKHEILEMLTKEGVRTARRNEHFPTFDSVKIWLKEISVTTDFFDSEFLSIQYYSKEEADDLKREVIEKTLAIGEHQFLIDQVNAYLGEQDSVQKSDLLFVFGGQSQRRIEKAVKLFHEGWAPLILIAGKSPHYLNDKETEASRFARRAQELGIPSEAIILEEESINIVDNIKRGFNLLEEKRIKHDTITGIIPWFAQRRAWSSLMKYSAYETKIIRVNSETTKTIEHAMEDRWFRFPNGIELIFNEYIKMKLQVCLNSS